MAKAIQTAAEAADRGEEYVEFMIPRTGRDDRAVFLGVNGESVRVLPGAQVSVKRKFAEVYAHSVAQQRAAWKADAAREKASKKPLAEL